MRAEIAVLHLRHYAGLAGAVRLKRAALEKIHAVLPLWMYIAGKFNINRIPVFILQKPHDMLYGSGKVGAFKKLAEVNNVGDTLAV